MISWIKGDLVDLWQTNNKFFILINCKGLGYEIQILKSIFIKLKTKQISHNITLWIKHIKKEDSDTLFGFISKDQKEFFVDILNIKGIGAQIGMALLNKFTINDIVNAINSKDKILISSVPGIGQKMTERLILELKNKSSKKVKMQEDVKNSDPNIEGKEISSMLEDLNFTLNSLNYPKSEIKNIYPTLLKDIKEIKNNINLSEGEQIISFERLLKLAMNHLDNKNSNLD